MNIDELLKIGIEREASDVHLKVGQHPTLRIHGMLYPLTGLERLSARDLEEVIEDLLNDYQKKKLRESMDVDFAYSLSGYGRFRGNIYMQRGTLAVSMRIIPFEIKSIRDLLLPEVLEKICETPRGLVLVTGTTGSGKTTTLASMIDHINRRRRERIITIEDPIEFLHADKMSMICQREVGEDVLSFGRGLRAALREDPDVILVGEMRDQDTIETAILAAETGHLVLSTLHTLDAPETINRIVAVFPPHQHHQLRLQLSGLLRAVISMRLVPRQDASGRVPAVEVMINTGYIQDCIMDADKVNLIRDAIQVGVSEYGMQTFDQSIYYLYQGGFISYEQGMSYSSSPDGFKLRVQGIQSTLDIALEDMEKNVGRLERHPALEREKKGKG